MHEAMGNKTSIFLDYSPTNVQRYPAAVKAGGLVFLSGVRPSNESDSRRDFNDIPAGGYNKKQGFSVVDNLESKVAYDSWFAHKNMDAVLEMAGSGGDQILRQHIWQKDKRFFPIYEDIRQVLQKVPSPSSGLGVSEVFGDPYFTIGIDAIAVCPDENPIFPSREVIAAVDDKDLPAASFYSQAVRSGPLVFTAGHIPIKTSEPGKPLVNSFDDLPTEGRFLETGRSHPDSRDGPIASQSWYVYKELERTLRKQGLDLSDTINATVFLADIRDFPTFHRIHNYFFPKQNTALTVSGFDEVGHRGCLIEIELTASASAENFVKNTFDWPAKAPFAAPSASSAGEFIFYSGVLGLNSTSNIVHSIDDMSITPTGLRKILENQEGYTGLTCQCWAAIDLLSEIAEKSNSSLDNLVKITVYLEKAEHFKIFDDVASAFLSEGSLPALECVLIPNPGPIPDAVVQIEAIGIRN